MNFWNRRWARNRGRQDRLGGELARLEETRERETVDLARLREEITALTAEAEDKRSVREGSQAVFTDLNLEYDLVVGRRDELGRELNGIRSRLVRLRGVFGRIRPGGRQSGPAAGTRPWPKWNSSRPTWPA